MDDIFEDGEIKLILTRYISSKNRLEILKTELKHLRKQCKEDLSLLIEEGERVGLEANIVELLKTIKYG